MPLAKADQRRAFPDARVEVLPGSGHYPHLDDSAAVAGIVVPSLRDVVGGRPLR